MIKQLTLRYCTGLMWLLLKQKDSNSEEIGRVMATMDSLEKQLIELGATDRSLTDLSLKAEKLAKTSIEDTTNKQRLFLGKLIFGQNTTLS